MVNDAVSVLSNPIDPVGNFRVSDELVDELSIWYQNSCTGPAKALLGKNSNEAFEHQPSFKEVSYKGLALYRHRAS